jgi:hypothetical protein
MYEKVGEYYVRDGLKYNYINGNFVPITSSGYWENEPFFGREPGKGIIYQGQSKTGRTRFPTEQKLKNRQAEHHEYFEKNRQLAERGQTHNFQSSNQGSRGYKKHWHYKRP